jgi:hypothetical protein
VLRFCAAHRNQASLNSDQRNSSQLRKWLRAAHDGRSYVANAAYGIFVAVLVLLAFLPTGVSATSQTISAYALTPQGSLLRLAFSCLALGSGLAAYEFWRSIKGFWGKLIASLIGVWVIGAVIDTVISVNPSGGHAIHGQIHAVVAVVAFSAVAGTVIAFVTWVCRASDRRRVAIGASALALVAVVIELSVTATSATFMAGTAERAFFVSALVWMIAARHTVARSLIPTARAASRTA